MVTWGTEGFSVLVPPSPLLDITTSCSPERVEMEPRTEATSESLEEPLSIAESDDLCLSSMTVLSRLPIASIILLLEGSCGAGRGRLLGPQEELPGPLLARRCTIEFIACRCCQCTILSYYNHGHIHGMFFIRAIQ